MASGSDILTILVTDIGISATKLITRCDDGTLALGKMPRSFLHDVEEREVCDLQSIGNALEQLEREPRKYVIRGQLIPGRPRIGVRRLQKSQQDSPANFHAQARRWCMIDIDELPLPPGVTDFRASKEQLVEIALAHLPSGAARQTG